MSAGKEGEGVSYRGRKWMKKEMKEWREVKRIERAGAAKVMTNMVNG